VSRDRSNDVIRTELDPSEYYMPSGVGVNAGLQTIPYLDGFESGNLDDWIIGNAIGTREVVETDPAVGNRCFYYENTTSGNHFNGITQEFEANSTPEYISFHVKSSSTTSHDAYFVTANGTTSLIWFYANAEGNLYVNEDVGGDASVPYESNRWYHIEYKDIDWTYKVFDYYVDGILIKADIPMRNPNSAYGITATYLYNFENSEAWWDQIQVGGKELNWLNCPNSSLTVAPGQSIDVLVFLDAAGLEAGNYSGAVSISGNDPLNNEEIVPVHLEVIGAPNISVSTDTLSFECFGWSMCILRKLLFREYYLLGRVA